MRQDSDQHQGREPDGAHRLNADGGGVCRERFQHCDDADARDPKSVADDDATRQDGDRLLAAGGRVASVTGVGKDRAEARGRAYAGLACLRLDGGQWRSDIGAQADEAKDGQARSARAVPGGGQ